MRDLARDLLALLYEQAQWIAAAPYRDETRRRADLDSVIADCRRLSRIVGEAQLCR